MSRHHRWLVILACALLPHRVRLRYRGEFMADLAALPARERTAYAMGVWRAAPALRWAIRGAEPRPMRCRLGLHRDRRAHHPDEMTIVSAVCRRCGRIKDFDRFITRGNADGVAYGTVFISQGH